MVNDNHNFVNLSERNIGGVSETIIHIFFVSKYILIAQASKSLSLQNFARSMLTNFTKKICIIAIYRAPSGNFDIFISKLDLILKKTIYGHC